MSDVGDALSGGGTSASGVSDTTMSDASLGDQMMGGDGNFGMGGSGGSFGSAGNDFNTFSAITNALTGGGASGVGAPPVAQQSASMTPPSAAAQTGGDPTGAAGGTQSNTTPGGSAQQNQPPTQQNQQQQSYAPPTAVAELRTLLKEMSGKPTGPTGPVPTGGQASPFALAVDPTSPEGAMERLRSHAASLAAGAPPQLSPTDIPAYSTGNVAQGGPGPAGTEPGGDKDIRTALPTGGAPDDFDPATGKWAGRTAAGTPADLTPLPPPRPKNLGAAPAAAPTPALPTRVPLPTKKPGASPAPAAAPDEPTPQPAPPEAMQPPSRLIQDITGASTGAPTALGDLVKMALPMLLPLLMGGLGGGRGRGGHFHGGGFGRFGGYRGGMNAMGHLHQGQHPMARGAWPYHHPQFGWHMHGRPPGPGWLPLNPSDGQSIVGGGQGQGDPNQQGGPDPNAPPKESGASVGPASSVPTSGALPGAGAKDVDDYTRSVATKWGIDPDVASKILAQESSYGQARRPGDNGTSFGPFQLHFAPDGRAMGDDFRRDTGLDPRDPSTWKAQVDYAMKRAAMGGWGPWKNTMTKLGLNQWSGITTNKRYAGKMGDQSPETGKQLEKAVTIPTTLPVTSQPMAAAS